MAPPPGFPYEDVSDCTENTTGQPLCNLAVAFAQRGHWKISTTFLWKTWDNTCDNPACIKMGAQFSSIFWSFHKEHDDAAEISGIPLSKPRETTSKAGTVRRHALSSTSALHLPPGSAEDPGSGEQITKSGWWFGTFCIFHILGITIPTDQIIFVQRGRYTTNQKMFRVSSESWTPATIRTCFAEHSACSAKKNTSEPFQLLVSQHVFLGHSENISGRGETRHSSHCFGTTLSLQPWASAPWQYRLSNFLRQSFGCGMVNPMFNPFR